ncbi:alpha/beta hydrolase [Patescibacteria group bacterium]|nr:alpha/beta hydrolase [Patescibacteria group bacterium]
MNNPHPQKKSIDTQNGKIFYWLDNSFPGRPCLVFLHGLSANHTTWLTTARALEKLQLNVLLLDLRGHGHSDKTKQRDLYRWPVFSQDLHNIICQENLTSLILIGYSFGGTIALDYAGRYPDSIAGLIIVSANYLNPLRYKRLSLLTWPAYGVLSFLAWLILWQKRKNYFYYDQDKTQSYWESTFIGLTTMPLSINFWMLAEYAKLNLTDAIGRINCPTLIIKSQHDLLLSSAETQDMALLIKNAAVLTLKKNTHFLASRHQDEITEIIINFLNQKGLI